MQSKVADLSNLTPAPGSTKNVKRIGRGRGSGHGDTATKGHKGQKARSGSQNRPVWFEGGQMPIQRRLPKRGFTQPNQTQYSELNISDLERITAEVIDPVLLRELHVVRGRGPVVLLGNGEITRPVNVKVHRITKTAAEKITSAGGTFEVLEVEPEFRRVKKGPLPRVKKEPTAK